MIDFIEMRSYNELDVDNEPILYLPSCGHFYTLDTLDSHMELGMVYSKNASTGRWLATLPFENGISFNKPRGCPECRAVIHSINRYGRVIRTAELIVLENKHATSVHADFNDADLQPPHKRVKLLKQVLKKIMKGPKRIVFEASGGSLETQARPNDGRLLTCYLKLAESHLSLIEESSEHTTETDAKFSSLIEAGIGYADEGILIGVKSNSIKSTTDLKLVKVELMIISKNETVISICDEIIKDPHPSITTEQKERATRLKENPFYEKVSSSEKKAIVLAMGGGHGHWYTCPNGHDYFIGECGGAMQTSRCAECGEEIGGNNHQLVGTNRISNISALNL